MSITITEALAEIKTILKRLEKKRQSIGDYLGRQDAVRDPLEKSGGSPAFIMQESQAISDLETRIIALRRGIQRANDTTVLAINGVSRTVSEWLTWRRDVAPGRQKWLAQLRNALGQIRQQAQRANATVVQASASVGENKPTDFIINIDERKLAADIEQIEDTLGQLDGKLSLLNATTTIQE